MKNNNLDYYLPIVFARLAVQNGAGSGAYLQRTLGRQAVTGNVNCS